MRFARRVFLIAGVYGVALLTPMYFFEDALGRQFPPPITHPELFYGFIGAVLAWQFVYLMISRDPARYRPMMLLAILAKTIFGVTVLVLLAQGRIAPSGAVGGSIDLVFAVLFAYAFVVTGRELD